MRESGHRPGLALEAGQGGGVPGDPLRQHLHRDLAVELGVPGAVHVSHPPGAEEGDDLVGPEASAGR